MYKSPLEQMSKTTPTHFWNDSCSVDSLQFALEHGAVGATTNPFIVGEVLEADLPRYESKIRELIDQNPTATEDDIAWLINEYMAVEGAKMLKPVFDETKGEAGYISIQTNAKYYRNAEKLTEQAVHFSKLAPNIMVKLPVTRASVEAVEESTYRGVTINGTVSFSVPQVIAVAEAIQRGMERREKEGKDNSTLHPICTIMVGRVDDWMKDIANSQNIIVDPQALEMAGVAVFKHAYKIFKERNYPARLLVAAYRNHYHWSEFIGGDISMTIPPGWIKRFVGCDITVTDRMDKPVDPAIINQLKTHIPDFARAYDEDGMKAEEFDGYGATRKTLMQFLKGYEKTVGIVRGIMLDL